MSEDKITIFLVGVMIGVVIIGITFAIFDYGDYRISQETADDICKNLTGNESAIAIKKNDEKLNCELPSYDSTQNIIIKLNNEEKR